MQSSSSTNVICWGGRLCGEPIEHLRRRYLTSLTFEQVTTIILKQKFQQTNVELLTKSIKNFGNFKCHFLHTTCAKDPRSMYVHVPHAMVQFVLKIEILSHIIGTAQY